MFGTLSHIHQANPVVESKDHDTKTEQAFWPRSLVTIVEREGCQADGPDWPVEQRDRRRWVVGANEQPLARLPLRFARTDDRPTVLFLQADRQVRGADCAHEHIRSNCSSSSTRSRPSFRTLEIGDTPQLGYATQTTTHSLVAALHEVIRSPVYFAPRLETFFHSYDASPRPISRKGKAQIQGSPTWSNVLTSDGTPDFLRNGPDRASMTGTYPQPRKSRSGGLKNTFRRLFGRKSAKDRISLPAPAGYPRHDPNEFITSAVDIAKQRSASAPNQTVVLRSSALNSHSPFPASLPNVAPVKDSAIPPRPERSPPPRPDRPRGASVPSVSLNAEEGVDWGDQVPGLGLHDTQDKRVDRASIGFAITSGSNPKRRSRSTDDLRHVPKEHRMSPIQWRQWRRRSDEIRYWRENADEDDPGFTAPDSRQPSPERTLARRQGFVERTPPLPEQREHTPTPPPPNAGEFNFGLASGAMQSQEHITLEERLVTLEIKLIDFEYAISKLQADIQTVDVKSPTEDISQHYEASPQPPSNPSFLQPPPKPVLENSPTSNYDQSPESTPGMQQMPFGIHHPANQPKPRPTSIATTLKPARGDRSSRNSMTELTIEHYTTLITLIRREQSARIHLEDQVSDLQRQIHSLQSSSPSSLRDIRDARRRPQYSSPASHSGRFDSIDDRGRHYTPPEEKRRPFSRDSNERFLTRQQQRHRYQDDGSRSRSNYNDETDTDDETYHDVYVTPVERGEFERRDLDGPEGLAF
ncbi:MAG: hypothetical protein L6R35_002369 [Caloplaca aegaea]|nr:MAG: hypothetical protein L6R35_002369 [Caloplaca aegaea]